MTILVDDFATGNDSLDVIQGSVAGVQSGNSILFGKRRTALEVTANPLSQSAHLDVGSGSLNLSTGVNQLHKLEISYGIAVDPENPGSVDLSDLTEFQIRFLTNNLPLNLNVVIFSGSKYSNSGVNLPANFAPWTEELYLADFTKGADFSAIDNIVVICQSGFAGQDYAIGRIEIC